MREWLVITYKMPANVQVILHNENYYIKVDGVYLPIAISAGSKSPMADVYAAVNAALAKK